MIATVTTSRRLLVGFLLMVFIGLPACSSRHWSFRSPPPNILRRATLDDGSRAVYELIATSSGSPRITETVTSTRETAYLGIRTRQLTTSFAASLGVPAWNGVYLDKVVLGSAADEAGLREGDILRFIDDTAITAPEQVTEIIDGQLRPEQEIVVRFQRWAPADDPDEAVLTMWDAPLVVGSRSVEQVITQAHKLPTSHGVKRHTGMTVGQVEPDLARLVFDRDEPVLLVAGVMSGSPAYLAGFRGGDRITMVDGEPANLVADVQRAVMLRAEDRGFKIHKDDFEEADAWHGGEVPSGRLELSVEGPLGPLTRRVRLVADVGDDIDFYFPILLSIESDTPKTKWSFLDFIIQFGANYNSTYVHSSTRSQESVTELSMLPFGMFEYNSSPEWTEWTFFWFITFSS